MADPVHALDGLRQIHLPAGADAALPMFAMIAVGFALAVALSLVLLPALRRRRAVRRAALKTLAASRLLPPDERLAAQAVLLRRLVRTIDGDEAARLTGAEWLARLDRLFATRFFSEAEGQTFSELLYRPPSGQDVAALDSGLERLFARIRR